MVTARDSNLHGPVMSLCQAFELSASRRWPGLAVCLMLLTVLAACGTHTTQHTRARYNPSRYYPPPGSSSDPWGPYIREASGRFRVPELWIRRVMRQESGGQEDVISWAGAMGLMQVMPDTYDGLRSRYNLGDDPFDPHNNILAGTAYLREMYDRFGAPGFLAAYNAGPNRLDSYLNNGRPLPDETVNYVASIAPLLGPETAMSGPLAVYAGATTRVAVARTSAGCDPDAAYNPDGPCSRLQPGVARMVAAAAPTYPTPYAASACDPDAAYDPTRPCRPLPTAPVAAVAYAPSYTPQGPCDPDAAYDPTRHCQPSPAAPAAVVAQALPPPTQPRRTGYAAFARPLQERMAQPAAFAPEPPPGRWAIQVGAFANLATAQSAAESARSALPDILRTAKVELPATTPFGSQVAFRARLSGLSPAAAADAGSRLNGRGTACLTVPPSRDSF
jgi:D-alanyl-D-alanine carboxypeptidase